MNADEAAKAELGEQIAASNAVADKTYSPPQGDPAQQQQGRIAREGAEAMSRSTDNTGGQGAHPNASIGGWGMGEGRAGGGAIHPYANGGIANLAQGYDDGGMTLPLKAQPIKNLGSMHPKALQAISGGGCQWIPWWPHTGFGRGFDQLLQKTDQRPFT
jgi:hypothetical protein